MQMDRQENNLSQKQPPKKPSATRIGLICLFGGVLAFLLIIAVIFCIPWKVTTLLILFLLACTVLPKALRKWFWLSVGVAVLALVVWVFLPDNNKGWRPYTFDEELAALQAKYAIPDSQNAAVIYNQLLDSYASISFDPNFADWNLYVLTMREPWLSKDYPQAAEWLKDHEKTIKLLLRASKIDKCRFPIYAATPTSPHRPPLLAAVRDWANLLTQAANNDLGDNRIQPCLEKCFAIIQLSEHVRQQHSVVLTMVGIALEGFATRMLQRFIITGHPTEQHLSTIEKTLAATAHDWRKDFPRVLEHEKLDMKNAWCTAYEVNSKGRTRLSRDPLAPHRDEPSEYIPKLTYWQKKLLKANTILSWFYMPANPRKLGKIIDTSYEKRRALGEPGFDWETTSDESYASLFLTPIKFSYITRYKDRSTLDLFVPSISSNSYYHFHEMYLRSATQKRGILISVYLRRYKNKHGFWPKFLDEIEGLTSTDLLIDPTNGGPFAYRRTDDNFTLYSKGKDNIDDNRQSPDDWPIWPNEH